MIELNVEISENSLTIREGSTILYTITAGKIVVHTKNFPIIVDQDGRDWSKDIREAPQSERPEYVITYVLDESDRTIDLFTTNGYLVVREGPIVLFQMKVDSCNMRCDREGIYEDGWDPLVEAMEFTLHKKGRYQYVEKHNNKFSNTDTIRIDLDTGDRVNISELERGIEFRKNPPPAKKKQSDAAGCCGCAAFLFILFLLIGLLGR